MSFKCTFNNNNNDNSVLLKLNNTIYFIFRFGRKNIMMGSSLIMLISSIGASFAPNISVFSFLRFITAASVSGLFQTGYILGTNFSNSPSNNLLLVFLKILFYMVLKIMLIL